MIVKVPKPYIAHLPKAAGDLVRVAKSNAFGSRVPSGFCTRLEMGRIGKVVDGGYKAIRDRAVYVNFDGEVLLVDSTDLFYIPGALDLLADL